MTQVARAVPVLGTAATPERKAKDKKRKTYRNNKLTEHMHGEHLIATPSFSRSEEACELQDDQG